MKNNSQSIYRALQDKIKDIQQTEISAERLGILQVLVDFIQQRVDNEQEVLLNFICTHNSRRSQFSQLWAQTAAYYYRIPVKSYSGGVEETAFNARAVASLERAGFEIASEGGKNPRYAASFSEATKPLMMYSKLYDDVSNPTSNFAAVMTCSHADENCPFIPGTDKRIPLLYDDPKEFDGTSEEAAMYDARSAQIGAELFYVFSNIEIG